MRRINPTHSDDGHLSIYVYHLRLLCLLTLHLEKGEPLKSSLLAGLPRSCDDLLGGATDVSLASAFAPPAPASLIHFFDSIFLIS